MLIAIISSDEFTHCSSFMVLLTGAHSSLGALSSSLLSAKPSNLEAGREATQRNSSVSMQQMHQLTQPHTPSPDLLSGGAGEVPVPGQPVRPSLGFGFSRHQLTILRNQILAFKRLKARKVHPKFDAIELVSFVDAYEAALALSVDVNWTTSTHS